MKYILTLVLLMFSANTYADGHEKKQQIFDAKNINDALERLGKVSFVYMCKENNKRYVIILSKGNKEGYLFYLEGKFPRRFTDIVIYDGVWNRFIETYGGVYSLNIVVKLYEKLIQGNFRVFENFTVEMVWDLESLSACDPPIQVADP